MAEHLDLSGEFSGIYATLNPVNPALLARRANRVASRLGRKDATTADADIVRRRWLPIDVDPVRPSGVSSTGDEHRAACETASAICDGLAELGWPRPVYADSGNGGHLLYRVDLPNDEVSTALVRDVLTALDARFSTDEAKVDTANFNAARIWKVYGTVGRKGDSTKDRPHRRSVIITKPYEPEVVPVELLRALVGSQPVPEPPSSPPAAPARKPGGFDLGTWLREHSVAIAAERPWQGGMLYNLEQCPFSDLHADGAYAIQFANGAIHVGCKHDSCGGGAQRWQETPRPARAGVRRAREAVACGTVGRARASREGTEARAPAERGRGDEGEGGPRDGDPFRYFLDCFAHDHVGDATLARCLVMSIASQTVRNSRGLHVYVTGESGKGKSSGMTAMLRQVPKSYRLAERMSNKALYYSDDIPAGTVLLLDDIALSEELQEVLKESTTKFTERIRMRVVNKDRKVQHCTIPERCVWWLANVSALYDEQVLNRMLICWVDDSEEQDREVYRRKVALEDRAPDEAIGDRFAAPGLPRDVVAPEGAGPRLRPAPVRPPDQDGLGPEPPERRRPLRHDPEPRPDQPLPPRTADAQGWPTHAGRHRGGLSCGGRALCRAPHDRRLAHVEVRPCRAGPHSRSHRTTAPSGSTSRTCSGGPGGTIRRRGV